MVEWPATPAPGRGDAADGGKPGWLPESYPQLVPQGSKIINILRGGACGPGLRNPARKSGSRPPQPGPGRESRGFLARRATPPRRRKPRTQLLPSLASPPIQGEP